MGIFPVTGFQGKLPAGEDVTGAVTFGVGRARRQTFCADGTDEKLRRGWAELWDSPAAP